MVSAVRAAVTVNRGSGSSVAGMSEQPAMGTVSYEDERPKRRRYAPKGGPVCPDQNCGGTLSTAHYAGRDVNEVYIRWRECKDCGLRYVTAEQAVVVRDAKDKNSRVTRLATFNEIDVQLHAKWGKWGARHRNDQRVRPERDTRQICGGAPFVVDRSSTRRASKMLAGGSDDD